MIVKEWKFDTNIGSYMRYLFRIFNKVPQVVFTHSLAEGLTRLFQVHAAKMMNQADAMIHREKFPATAAVTLAHYAHKFNITTAQFEEMMNAIVDDEVDSYEHAHECQMYGVSPRTSKEELQQIRATRSDPDSRADEYSQGEERRDEKRGMTLRSIPRRRPRSKTPGRPRSEAYDSCDEQGGLPRSVTRRHRIPDPGDLKGYHEIDQDDPTINMDAVNYMYRSEDRHPDTPRRLSGWGTWVKHSPGKMQWICVESYNWTRVPRDIVPIQDLKYAVRNHEKKPVQFNVIEDVDPAMWAVLPRLVEDPLPTRPSDFEMKADQRPYVHLRRDRPAVDLWRGMDELFISSTRNAQGLIILHCRWERKVLRQRLGPVSFERLQRWIRKRPLQAILRRTS